LGEGKAKVYLVINFKTKLQEALKILKVKSLSQFSKYFSEVSYNWIIEKGSKLLMRLKELFIDFEEES